MSIVECMCAMCLTTHGELVEFGQVYICKECEKQVLEAEENSKKPLHEIEQRSPQPLCTRCGVCCFMLRAEVDTAEIENMARKFNLPFDKVGSLVKERPERSVINFPCEFLVGRPLQYVRCHAYGSGTRPEVCRVYVCRVAIMYSLRALSLNEALFSMRQSMILGDFSIFNWGFDKKDDRKLLFAKSLVEGMSGLMDQGYTKDAARLVAAEAVTKRWDFKSETDHALFSMQMDHASRKDYDPKLFVPEGRLSELSEVEVAFAREVIGYVLEIFLEYVEPGRSFLGEDGKELYPKQAPLVDGGGFPREGKLPCGCCDRPALDEGKERDGGVGVVARTTMQPVVERFNEALGKDTLEEYGAAEYVTALEENVPDSVRHAIGFLASEIVRSHVRISNLEEEVADLNRVVDRYEELEEVVGKPKDELN